MRGRNAAIAASALATAALLAATSAEATCHIHRADLPIEMEGRAAVVTTKINGQEARFQVDSGNFYSMLTPAAAKRLKLRDIPMPSIRVQGVGGEDTVQAAEAKEFDFAGVPLKGVEFIVGGRQFAPGTVGLLGENVLSVLDVEYDFANGVMRLIKPEDCYGHSLAYWAGDTYGVIPIGAYAPPQESEVVGRVKINGHWVRAMFDTGASSTLLSRTAAERVGVDMNGPDVKANGVGSGIGRGVIETWTAPIDSFAIGDEEIKNTRLTIAKMDSQDGTDMLLGMDFFLSHRVLVSRSQNKLYFTYNGGSVFRVDGPPPPAAPAPGASAPAPAAAGAAQTPDAAPASADELSRRGDALMSRRDFAGALEAFDKAVELEPKEPQRYLERARARLALGRHILAMADLDHALELKPDFAPALIARGELFLRNGDLARAGADFDAAIKASPNEDLRLRIASAYMRNARYELAISQYDAWIAVHARDEELWTGLNSRCWARAMMGKELDKALEDCNAAMRKGPRNSQVLDSRGMVHLRLGQYHEAIDDYDAALKLQPKLPWSLYGRGLAKQKLGDAAGGAADIAAAVALDPGLPAQAKRIGLVDAAPPAATYSGPAPAAAAPAPAKPKA